MPNSLKKVEERENNRDDREDSQNDEPQSMWAKFGGLTVGAKGRHLTHLVYVTALAVIILLAIWAHEQSTLVRTKESQDIGRQTQTQIRAIMEEIKDKQDETIFVLTRTEEQRKALNLETPPSLRKKMRQDRQ